MPAFVKFFLAITVLSLTLVCIGVLFWYNEWRYSLPTPVPAQYQSVQAGNYIDIGTKLKYKKSLPVFLHFFNPDCPCSRFNMPHFKALAATYGNKINFAVVVITKDKDYTEATIRKKYGLAIPVLFDTSIATICGVYSTPQAVLINTNQLLYYRGNYNRSRYCTDEKSNYAQIAINDLLASNNKPVFNNYALTAYGCSLPGCKQ